MYSGLSRRRSGYPLAAIVLAALAGAAAPAAAGGGDPAANRPVTASAHRAGAVTELSAPGIGVFYTTESAVSGLRAMPLEGSKGLIAVWDETAADGSLRHFYAVSTDGRAMASIKEAEYVLRLMYGQFDPLTQAAPATPAELTGGRTAEDGLYYVQFLIPPTEAMQSRVASLGGKVCDYQADHACVVRMSEQSRAAVAGLPYVRWVGPVEPAYKVESFISGKIGAGVGIPARKYMVTVYERGLAQQAVVGDRIAALGGKVLLTTPLGFFIEATLTLDQITQLAAMPEVAFIDRKGEPEPDMDIVREFGGANYISGVAGFNGEGVRGEVLDTGLRTSHKDFQATKPILHTSAGFDTYHGTHTYGIVFGDGTAQAKGKGMLPKGQGIFASYNYLTDRYVHTADLVNPTGPYRAVFQSNSWGGGWTTSYTSESAQMDDIIFLDDILICQSQSNSGSTYSRPQAWAKNIVSIGGINHVNTLKRSDDYWSGASIGPAIDGRIKPDLSSFYDSVWSTDYGSDSSYNDFSGTSSATPIVAGHFGLLFQMWAEGVFHNPTSGDDVFDNKPHFSTAKALMINTGGRYAFTGASHNLSRDKQGWGTPDVKALYDARDNLFIVDETETLAPFAKKDYVLNVKAGEPELRAVMTYSDPKGTPGSAQARINDLTLRVQSPSGKIYWGSNKMREGNVTPEGGAANTKDTVECVFLLTPEAGDWTFTVSGDDIVADAHKETTGLDADFSLVIVGAAEAGGGECAADCNKDGKLNINDFLCFKGKWDARDPYGDYDLSGTYTINDFISYQAAFTKGCP